MEYVWLQTQIWQNNIKSTLLLLAFPWLILSLTWVFFFFKHLEAEGPYLHITNQEFFSTGPWVIAIVWIWFLIAYFSHSSMINNATWSHPLERKDNIRVYNLVENLCIASWMKNPKINIIDDDSLNAYASWINEDTYTVSLSSWIINKLNDDELKWVIAHELTHIKNKDVRLLIISIIFVWIFAFLSQMLLRVFVYWGSGRSEKKDWRLMIIAVAIAFVWYLLSVLFRFALSRKREYLADAWAVELTKNARALASALQKVSSDSRIEAVKRKDVAQLFIENPQEKKKWFLSSAMWLFATHPSIEKRIEILKRM